MLSSLWLSAGIWGLWCSVHSLLAVPRTARLGQRLLNIGPSCYRLLYNGLALFTLAPILLWSEGLPGAAVLIWHGPLRIFQALFWTVALYLGWAGARAYTLRTFLGLDCLRSAAPEPDPRLVTDGVLGLVRHPWYLAGWLVLWGRDLNPPGLVTAVVLSIYLLFGAWVEERRMATRFGSVYRDYQQRVPMLFPWRRLLRIGDAFRGRRG